MTAFGMSAHGLDSADNAAGVTPGPSAVGRNSGATASKEFNPTTSEVVATCSGVGMGFNASRPPIFSPAAFAEAARSMSKAIKPRG
jgi:hypothetical protein